MKLLIERYLASLKRFLGNSGLRLQFYGAWALGVCIIFGGLGIGNLLNTTFQKLVVLNSMVETTNALERKRADIEEKKKTLEVARPYLQHLNYYMPDKVNMHLYMMDFVVAASSSGYTVKSFMPSKGLQKGEYEIIATLEGFGEPGTLVASLEDLKRITDVKSIQYGTKFGNRQLIVKVSIFSEEDL